MLSGNNARAGRGYRLTVYGTAQPGGSKRGFYRPGLGVRVIDANPKAKDWKGEVAREAGRIADGMLEGALSMRVTFYRVRPKGHYGSGKNSAVLKPTAPPYPSTKPDTTKLLRCVEDALTGILYRDDAQVCRQSVVKLWGEIARVVIVVEQLGADAAEKQSSEVTP